MKKGFSSRFLKKIVVIFLCIGVVFSFSGCLVEWIANSLKKQNKYEYKTINTYLEIIIANSENILSNDLENMFKSIKKRYIMFIRRKNKNI